MRIGVDLGGTKIEAIAIAPDGATLTRRRVETPRTGYAPVLDAIAALIVAVEAEAGTTAARIGVGTPGSLSPGDGRMRNSNSTVLNGERLDIDLNVRYEQFKTNDWAVNGVDPDTIPTVLTLGANPYDYDVWVVGVSFRYLVGGRDINFPE